jgi:hypothetical protein
MSRHNSSGGKKVKRVIIGLAATLVITGAAFAQGPPGGMPPEFQKMMGEFQKMRNSPKGKLGTTLRALGEFNGDPKTKLTKPQATKILGLLTPWKPKTGMSQDEAAALNKQITGTFTLAQIKKQATMGAQGGMGGGGGRPGGGMGGGRPGGGMGGPGGGGMPDPKKMMEGLKKSQAANPINPMSYPESPWRQRMVDNMNKLFGALQSAAK